MNFVIDCQILVKKGLNDSRMALLFSWHAKTPPYGAHQNWMVSVKNAKISLFSVRMWGIVVGCIRCGMLVGGEGSVGKQCQV